MTARSHLLTTLGAVLIAIPAAGFAVTMPIFSENFEVGTLEHWSAVAPTCTETEPNGTSATANSYCRPFSAQINPAGDLDFLAIHSGGRFQSLRAETLDGQTTTCLSNNLDSKIDVFDFNGVNVGSDNDSGAGLCSVDLIPGLHPRATYFVRVGASNSAAIPTFTYGLAIDLTETPCQETVANDTQAQAEPYCAPWFGTIFPAGDADFVKVQPTSSGTMTVATSDFGDGACASNGVNTIVRIFDVNGTELTVDDDSGPGDCSLATRSVIGNAVYFVKVQAAPAASPVTFEYRLDITVP